MPHRTSRPFLRAPLAGLVLLLCLTWPGRAAFNWTNLGSLGSTDFSIDPGSLGSYTQTAAELTFNKFGLGDSIYGFYTSSDWSSYENFGIRIDLDLNPNVLFDFYVYDSTYTGGNTGYNRYAGSTDFLDGDVIELTLEEGSANLAEVIGIGFGVNGDASIPLTTTHIAAATSPPPATGGSFTASAPGGVFFHTKPVSGGVANILATVAANATNWTYSFVAPSTQLPPNSTSWSVTSDSNAKTAVTPVDHRATLRKVASLPVTSWNYKHDLHRRYVGPMAQDFHGAFGLGHDDKHISTLDTDGVTLSAIKGLIAELHDRKARSAAQAKRLAELEAELQTLSEKLRGNLPPAE